MQKINYAEPSCALVADNIYQVRLPLPFALNHVNCYVLHDPSIDQWTVVEGATLSALDGILQFSVGRPESLQMHYRVVAALPGPLFAEDFERGAVGWSAIAEQGSTDWELGNPSTAELTKAHSGENVFGTDLRNWTTKGISLSPIGNDDRRLASVAMDAPKRYLRLVVGTE